VAISLAWWPEHPDLRPWRGSDYWLPASLCFDVPRGELARTGVAIRNVEPDASSRRASRAPRAGLACLWRGPGARRRSEALSGLAAATLGQAGPPVGRQRCRRGLHGGRRSAATYPRGTDRRCWGSCRHGRLRPPVPPNPVPDRSAPAPLSRRPSTSRARSSATAFREGPRRCTTPCSPIWRWGSRASLQPLTTQIRVLHVQQVGVAAPLPRLGTGRAPSCRARDTGRGLGWHDGPRVDRRIRPRRGCGPQLPEVVDPTRSECGGRPCRSVDPGGNGLCRGRQVTARHGPVRHHRAVARICVVRTVPGPGAGAGLIPGTHDCGGRPAAGPRQFAARWRWPGCWP